VLAILGGAKDGTKIGVITNLMKQVDAIFIGGGMAYTFMKVQGKEIGTSLFDAESADLAKQILADAAAAGKRLLFPTDVVVADKFDAAAATKVVSTDAIPADWMAGHRPATLEMLKGEIAKAKTIVWNGPVGVFEMEAFARGTRRGRGVGGHSAVTVLGAATRRPARPSSSGWTPR
jgi:3-phosphoglycerate kinase